GSRMLSAEVIEKAAQKLEVGEPQQPAASVQRSRSAVVPRGRSNVSPARRRVLRKKNPAPVFLSQPLLRRAAVAALAASTLALPYLAAKMISGTARPGAPSTAAESQALVPTVTRESVPSAAQLKGSTERATPAASSQPLADTSRGSKPEAVRIGSADDG